MSALPGDISKIMRLNSRGLSGIARHGIVKEGSLRIISTTPLTFSSLERFKVARTPPKYATGTPFQHVAEILPSPLDDISRESRMKANCTLTKRAAAGFICREDCDKGRAPTEKSSSDRY